MTKILFKNTEPKKFCFQIHIIRSCHHNVCWSCRSCCAEIQAAPVYAEWETNNPDEGDPQNSQRTDGWCPRDCLSHSETVRWISCGRGYKSFFRGMDFSFFFSIMLLFFNRVRRQNPPLSTPTGYPVDNRRGDFWFSGPGWGGQRLGFASKRDCKTEAL